MKITNKEGYEITFLDLEKVTLLGFEHTKDIYKISEMVERLEKGIAGNIPPVLVKKIIEQENTYILLYEGHKECKLGGHHRALAHYIAGKPLKCMILEEMSLRYLPSWRNNIPIQKIKLEKKNL